MQALHGPRNAQGSQPRLTRPENADFAVTLCLASRESCGLSDIGSCLKPARTDAFNESNRNAKRIYRRAVWSSHGDTRHAGSSLSHLP